MIVQFQFPARVRLWDGDGPPMEGLVSVSNVTTTQNIHRDVIVKMTEKSLVAQLRFIPRASAARDASDVTENLI
jgi:hypothetical protein